MMAGAVDAGLFNEPVGYQARQQGYAYLYDLATMGVEYPTTSLGVLRSTTTERPAAVRGFMAAIVESLAWVKQNPDEAIAVLSRFSQLDDAAALRAAYDEHAPRFPQAPYVSNAAMTTIFESIRDTEPRAVEARPSDLTDDRFVRELEESGFIRGLYP